MSPSTLKELVNLWREVNTTPSPPSVFISQKLEPYQNDKIEIWHTHTNPTYFLGGGQDGWVLYKHRYGWVLYKYRYLSEEERRSDRYVTRHLYTYQRANPDNICDFQIKPPVKSLFTGIPGPYKII